MSEPDPDLQTGLIIIRLWRSGRRHEGLRAQLTVKLTVEGEETATSAASSLDALCAEVRRWGEAFLHGGSAHAS